MPERCQKYARKVSVINHESVDKMAGRMLIVGEARCHLALAGAVPLAGEVKVAGLHTTVNTVHCPLYTVQCTLRQCSVQCTLYTALQTVHCILHAVTQYSAHCTLQTVQCTLHAVILYSAHCTLHTEHCILHVLKVYIAHCTLHREYDNSVHYTLNTAHFTW